MKKNYIQPSVAIDMMEVATVIAGSITNTSNVEGLGVGGSSSAASVTAGAAKERDSQESSDAWNEGLW